MKTEIEKEKKSGKNGANNKVETENRSNPTKFAHDRRPDENEINAKNKRRRKMKSAKHV